MKETINRACKALFCSALALHATACGTILHPERKGQTQGPIDVGIAVLDGIGLLFFIIPGVIAYAVDFTNGAIYLPSADGRSKIKKASREIRFDPKGPRVAQIEAILRRETGKEIHLADARGIVVPLDSSAQLPAYFASAPIRAGADIFTARR